MRQFLDDILSFIGQTSLTDAEFNSVTAQFTILDDATYGDLSRILKARDSVSNAVDRLTSYYVAGGFDPKVPENTSNIFVGAKL